MTLGPDQIQLDAQSQNNTLPNMKNPIGLSTSDSKGGVNTIQATGK